MRKWLYNFIKFIKRRKPFPLIKQIDTSDCGATCLAMLTSYHEIDIDLEELREQLEIGKDGVTLLDLSDVASNIGLNAYATRVTIEDLERIKPLPCILHWNQNHYVVLVKIYSGKYLIADPANGFLKLGRKEFENSWIPNGTFEQKMGVCLFVEKNLNHKSVKVSRGKIDEHESKYISWKSLFIVGFVHNKATLRILGSMVIAISIQYVFPFLTKMIVDVGIGNKNLSFIRILLIGQLFLIIVQSFADLTRSKILLRSSFNISKKITSDFWKHILKLPISFFEERQTGDIMQRIVDLKRIESYLSSSALQFFYSISTIFIFGISLLVFDYKIFFLFFFFSIIYILWISSFRNSRTVIDAKRFDLMSKESSYTLQILNGIKDIKINNSEEKYLTNWGKIQAQFFDLSFKSFSLEQRLQIGAVTIGQVRNLFITYVLSTMVVENILTLGSMMAVQYIIGQLNGPIESLLGFLQTTQDANASLKRLNHIHTKRVETEYIENEQKLPKHGNIRLIGVFFKYPFAKQHALLDVSIEIPANKVTAIVGRSGSGKSTLIKILLKMYEDYEGKILYSEVDLKNLSHRDWRERIGVVMQEGYIFQDTIENNVTMLHLRSREEILGAIGLSGGISFMSNLDCKLGPDGIGLSGGQKQRVTISRALVRNPYLVFLDEATNSLDSTTELEIQENFVQFFEGKTVVVVAHRLSTIRNADNIIVFENGRVVEQGTYEELLMNGKAFRDLVKNQI